MFLPSALRRTIRQRWLPIVLIGVLCALAAGTATSILGPEPSSSREFAAPSAASEPSDRILVHVVGEVTRPGIVSLMVGSLVVDALAAAGGVTGTADQGALNLAREVKAGEQIVVPQRGASIPGASASGLINLNTADQNTLETLPRVGPALAQKIIGYRTAHGGFRSVDELSDVPGIGAKTFADLAPLVTV